MDGADVANFHRQVRCLPGRDVEKVFFGLNESLKRNRGKVGDEQYIQLADMARRMRAHFEADPEDKTDDTIKGRELIEDMRDLLKAAKTDANLESRGR